MTLPKLTAKQRQRLYLTALAGLALLAGYNIIDQGSVPLWVELVGSALGITGTGTAAVTVAKQRKDGTLS